jgi:Pre-PUA-like domain
MYKIKDCRSSVKPRELEARDPFFPCYSVMFKKPLADLKTFGRSLSSCSLILKLIQDFLAPLRSSDRRKLKQRIIRTFSLQPDIGDDLVPNGILSAKFITHLDESGVVYFSPDGDPLWMTLGKGSDDLIPTGKHKRSSHSLKLVSDRGTQYTRCGSRPICFRLFLHRLQSYRY